MSKIVIGESGGKDVRIDLDLLLSTRLLLTADSGGGKTFALKRFVEQAFGKIQILILDPEGEFSPLREKLDFVLVGKGGETPADVRSAALVAQTLLKLRACAIVDLYEMKPSERHSYVKAFLDAMIEAPKEVRHPCIVIVDEAHIFCPEHGKGESIASESMISLCTRGRKRLLCPLFATQRLATLSKDASSMLLNRMIGPTFEDINRKRAAAVLGIAKDGEKEFYKHIQTLEPGNFFCLGRAISKEMILVHIGGIETPHGQDALKYEMKPPPAPEKIKALLPSLADLPKEAETKAKNEAELRHEIHSLKAQLAARPVEQKVTVEEKIVEVQAVSDAQVEELRRAATAISAIVSSLSAALASVTQRKPVAPIRQSPRPISPRPISISRPAPSPESSNHNSHLSAAQVKILSRLVELLECTGMESVRKEQLAAWSEYSPNSGGYNNYLGFLRSAGMIEYPSGGMVTITEEGRKHAQPGQIPVDNSEMLDRAKRVLGGSEGKLLEILHETRETVDKTELAEAAGFSPNSGGFNNYLGHMRTLGFIDYPSPGKVRCSDWMYVA